MSVSAPRRPPGLRPVERDETEALIKEARRRARRRRLMYSAAVGFAALAGLAVFTVFERTASSAGNAPTPASRSSVAASATGSKIAFLNILQRSRLEFSFELFVMKP